ncbi:hypothetical protein [Bremerella alba]|uniref:Uncharacterized protein n=1 Tax=Bremerella alba TaxID=980252 RepID=A0A7V8V992_9BACT|nr:hypothetical protein [Bremerella alba]MBA2117226.1 hypothetical protein [Bremerella alba]
MFLERAGFAEISIKGFQRYPLANHLHWLAKGKASGHLKWSQLRTPTLEAAYGEMLAGLNQTDTLIATATAP